MERHMVGLRETAVPSWQFELLIWDISSGFPLATYITLPSSESYLVYLRVLLCVCVCVCVLAKMDSSEEAYMQLDITPFFDLQGTFLCMYGQTPCLEFWSTENNSRCFSWEGRERGKTSTSCLITMEKYTT